MSNMNTQQSTSSILKVMGARGLFAKPNKSRNPYCVVGLSSPCKTMFLDAHQCVKSEVVKKSLNPEWRESELPTTANEFYWRVEVWDKVWYKIDKFLGYAIVERNPQVDFEGKWVPLQARVPKAGTVIGEVHVVILINCPQEFPGTEPVLLNVPPMLAEHNELSELYFANKVKMPLSKMAKLMVYGKSNEPLTRLPNKLSASLTFSHCPQEPLTLSHDGKLKFVEDFTIAGFKIINPKMYQREGLLLVRGDNCETGISYCNQDSLCHYFFFEPEKMGLLQLKTYDLRGGHTGSIPNTTMQYYSPVAFLPSNEIIRLHTTQAERYTIKIPPRACTGPLIIAFSFSKISQPKEIYFKNLYSWITFELDYDTAQLKRQVFCVDKNNNQYKFPTQALNTEK